MRYALLFGLLLLTACAGNLQRLHDLNPAADNFNSALASEYASYADSESEQGRKAMAEHYAGKGLDALKGKNVEPEEPDMALSAEDQQQLAKARAALMNRLTDDIKRVAPQKLARAQLLFDCWQHQLSKDLNQDKAPCAEEFKATMTELQKVSDYFAYNQEDIYDISFTADSAVLSDEAGTILEGIAAKLKDKSHYTVALESHGDNDLVSKRLAAVRKALVSNGIASKYIRLTKEGSANKVFLDHETTEEHKDEVIITVKTRRKIKD